MASVFLRPDLKTAGGEVNDILLNGRYVGSLSIIYRENQRISGAIQLDEPSLPSTDKDYVLDHVQTYVQAFASSVEAAECTLYVSCSPVDCYIDHFELNGEEDEDLGDEGYFEDLDEEIETLEMEGKVYRLVIVGEGRSNLEYHVYDEDQEWAAEALITIHDEAVSGDIHWLFDPEVEEIEAVTALLVSDFDEEAIHSMVLSHHYGNELIERINCQQVH